MKAHPSVSLETLLLNPLRHWSRRVQELLRTPVRSLPVNGSRYFAQRRNQLYRLLEPLDAASGFDKARGVDTTGPVALRGLSIRSENLRHAVRYEGVDPSLFRQALRSIPEDFSDFTFIDLGCGKGRALLLAHEFGFSEIIGVDFAPELTAIARDNCQRARVRASILTLDAIEFSFPPGNLLVYLFNPFGPAVLNPVLNRLLASHPTKCYVVYINPLHRWLSLDARPELECVSYPTKRT